MVSPLGTTLANAFLSFYEIQSTVSHLLHFKDRLPKDLLSGVIYKYTCRKCSSLYYGETDRHLKVRSGEHTGISPLTSKRIKPAKDSAVHDHLFSCKNEPSFDEFPVLARASNKLTIGIKESLLIKKDKPILNRNTSSIDLLLFDST